MTGAPRAWPGVTVPADYYDGETRPIPIPAFPTAVAQPTFGVRRHRPRLTAVLVGVAIGIVVLTLLGDPSTPLRLLLNITWLFALLLNGQKAVAVTDAGSSVILQRGKVSPEPGSSMEVGPAQIVCVRPPHQSRVARRLRPEVWQIGPERVLVDSRPLSATLQRLTGVPAS